MADQGDLVAAVKDQDLIGQVDLDSLAAASGDQHRRETRIGQRLLHRRAHRVLDGQALDLLEGPYGLEGIDAEPPVVRPCVVPQRRQPLLELGHGWSPGPWLEDLAYGLLGRGGRR